jgi:hypothetical protein
MSSWSSCWPELSQSRWARQISGTLAPAKNWSMTWNAGAWSIASSIRELIGGLIEP